MKTIEKFYNSFDLERIALSKRFKDYLLSEGRKIKNLIKGGKVLDVGCGGGRIIGLVINQVNEIYGIDISKKALDFAREKYRNNKKVKLYLENSTNTHFNNNYFDWIILGWNTLGNLGEDLILTIKELKRVLKPGGKIVLSVFSENVLLEYMKLLKINSLKIQSINKDQVILENGLISERFNTAKLKRIFNNHGLSINISTIAKLFYWCEAKHEKQ